MGRTILLAEALAPSFGRDGYELNWTRGPPAPVVRSSGNFNPTLAVVVSTMIIAFFLVGFATGYVKRLILGPEAAENLETLNRQRRMNVLRRNKPPEDGGLDPEVVKALPLVQYADYLKNNKECEYHDDCPVCLAVFEDSDRLRLLPHCAHAFHSDCIDEWFRSHSTCPLCRGSLEGANSVQDHVDVVIHQGGESSAGFSQEASTEPEQEQEDDDASIIRMRTVSSIRRSSSVGTGLSQHNRDLLNLNHAIAMDQEQASTLMNHSRLRVLSDYKGGAGGLQSTTRWSLPNLLQIAPL